MQRKIVCKRINIQPIFKIDDKDFKIPSINQYYYLINYNYNVKQLKEICKYFNLKISGNKLELRKRIYNYMYVLYNVIYIQKVHRKNIVKTYIYLHGPGFMKRKCCTNDIDFLTLDSVEDIPYTQFFSYIDDTNHMYGFDILSIYNLYKKNSKFINPFTTKDIPNSITNYIFEYIKYSSILNLNTNISYEIINHLSDSKMMHMKIVELFQIMDNYGNYTNISWLTTLNRNRMIKFIRELYDIWSYRANINQYIKCKIVPPHGNPFSYNDINSVELLTDDSIKKYIVVIIEQFITKGLTYDDKVLGTMYVLTAFTLVSDLAADAMPWLYDSAHNN